jgi:hypothetical protein|tara:strand:+ start:677 stop:808 length:132 start_codon:yes stop_codon:yes gene_type:complete
VALAFSLKYFPAKLIPMLADFIALIAPANVVPVAFLKKRSMTA